MRAAHPISSTGKGLSLIQKLTVLVLLPLVFEFLFVGLLSGLLILADQDGKRVEDAKHTQSVVSEVVKGLYKATASGCMYPIRKDEFSRMAYEESRRSLPMWLEQLRVTCASDKKALRSAEIVTILSNRLLNYLDSVVALDRATLFTYGEVSTNIAALYERVMSECAKITAAKAQIQSYRGSGINWQMLIFSVLAIGLTLSVIASIFILRFVHRDLISRLDVMVENTRRVSHRLPLNPVLEGKDEISQLDRFIHEMDASILKADQMRQEFMSMLTHDMRTPITNVTFLLGMIAEGTYDANPQKRRRIIENVFPEINRLSRLIEDLLTLDKLESGKLTLVSENVSARTLLEEVQESLSSEATSHERQIVIDSDDLPFQADAFQIKRVLINLAANALKFTQKGSLVTLSAKAIASGIRFEVMDEGPGIKAESIPELFNRYQQGSDEMTRSGFGLGLAICKAIVEEHQGAIGAKNREDRPGAIFFFELPNQESSCEKALQASS